MTRARSMPPLLWRLCLLTLALACALTPGAARSAPAAQAPLGSPRQDVPIPDLLRPWVGWVLHGHEEEALCPAITAKDEEDSKRCAWPTSLSLTLGARGGQFAGRFRLFWRALVTLPGDDKAWPQGVRVDGKPAVVTASPQGDDDDRLPVVLLGPGEHTVSGAFQWEEMPESLAVPQDTGLLSLSVSGERIPLPLRDDNGRVFLHRAAAPEEEDVLDVTVHRKITDDIPLLLTTRVALRISGKAREVLLARALPQGFTQLGLSSPLPAKLEQDGRLRVQARPGTFEITLEARHAGPDQGGAGSLSLSLQQPEGPWAAAEVWAFEARPALRVVTVEGVPAVDPNQTTLPAEWRRLPCYPVRPGDTLRLVEQRRGDADPAPDELTLSRQLWLDFDGGGFTAHDQISGAARRAWRLEVDPPAELGRASVSGTDQLITRAPASDGGRSGVEIRQGQLALDADLRLARSGTTLPAVGWHSDFHGVTLTLNLPPGWRLLHASGADDAPGTWVRSWTLLDLFLLLIFSMAVGRLFGRGWGALALVALALSLPEQDAPRWAWPPVLAAVALLRVVPQGRPRTLLRALLLVGQVVLVLVLADFGVQQVRHGLYPALEQSRFTLGGDQAEDGRFSRVVTQTADVPAAAPMSVAEPEPKEESEKKPQDEDERVMNEIESGDKSGARPPRHEPARKMDKRKGKGVSGKEKGDSDKKNLKLEPLPVEAPPPPKVAAPKPRMQAAQEFDPNAIVQTGPGLPRWSWSQHPLRFSGPVDRGQQIHLLLVPPWANLLLALLRVGLLFLLVLRILGLGAHLPQALRRLGLGLLPLIVLLSPAPARADLPQQAVLDELRERLLKPPECHPRCAASQRLLIEVSPGALRLRLEVGAAAATAVPLPGAADQWLPAEVLLDGRPAPALMRNGDARLWLHVPEGMHQVTLAGPLPDRDTVQLALPLKPHHVEVHAKGWQVDGVHEDGQVDEDLQFSREQGNRQTGQRTLQPEAPPPFVRVERDLQIGLQWQVSTRVVRVTPPGTAVVLEVPLLPGESVTTAEVRVKGGKALVNMGPAVSEVEWRSLLQVPAEAPAPLVLSAPKAVPWTEVWRLDLGPIWHAELAGVPQVHQQDGVRRPEWRPWPGEQVRLSLTRPKGDPGRSLTIDRSHLLLRPGQRTTDATLELALRSSRGDQRALLLPPGAQLQSVAIDGQTQPLLQEGERVMVPVRPGAQAVKLEFRYPEGIGLRYAAPVVALGGPSVNAEVEIRPGPDGARWILLCGGPRLGPAVLFWGFLAVLGLVALGLGRVRLTPLRTVDWLLLGLGLTQVPLVYAAVLCCWLLALGWRQRNAELRSRVLFNLRQVALVVWGLWALGVLVSAVRDGLLGQPDMQITGNGSSPLALRWFADRVAQSAAVMDRVADALPRPWVISLPLWAYRVAMLLWALWLARALLGWLGWAWRALGQGGLWVRRPPKVKEPAVQQEPASQAGPAPPPGPGPT